MTEQVQHHYERVIEPHLAAARKHAAQWGDAPHLRVLIKLVERGRGQQMVALQSIWGERGLEELTDDRFLDPLRQALAEVGDIHTDPDKYAEDMPSSFVAFRAVSLSGQEVVAASLKLAQGVGYTAANAQGEALSQAMVAWQTARFRAAGRRTFQPSSGLAQQLLLTELKGIKGQDLQLPFSSIYIEVPIGLGFQTFNTQTGWHNVTGVYVSTDLYQGYRGFRVLITAKGNETDPKLAQHDDALSHFFVPLVDDELIDETLEAVYVNITGSDADRAKRNLPEDDELLWRETREWLSVFRWVMNLIFYTTSPVCEREDIEANKAARQLWARIKKLPGGKKRTKLVHQAKAMARAPRIVLGRSIKLDRSMPTNTEEKQRSGATGRMLSRTLVSGHWQRFAVGKGRVDRIWKFRAPFWRGDSDLAAAQVTTHELGGSDA